VSRIDGKAIVVDIVAIASFVDRPFVPNGNRDRASAKASACPHRHRLELQIPPLICPVLLRCPGLRFAPVAQKIFILLVTVLAPIASRFPARLRKPIAWSRAIILAGVGSQKERKGLLEAPARSLSGTERSIPSHRAEQTADAGGSCLRHEKRLRRPRIARHLTPA
jgi:hypothetical protein